MNIIQKGSSSGRPFNPLQAGGKILKLNYTKVKVTSKDIDIVEAHINRFSPFEEDERKMVQRLKKILTGQIQAEPVDLRFYTHEIREYLRYKKLGYPTGQPDDPDQAYELWNNAHTATLEDYGLREGLGVLFHLDL
jgi:hypothetical protein